MASRRPWVVDGRAIARKISQASSSSIQITDGGSTLECPKCHYLIDNSDVSQWPGFPAGVKFDPSDVEILHHLAAKCRVGDSEEHPLIGEFIPTLEEDHGICYTHPENLPGAKKDGSNVYFFHPSVNAYATGQRKRRKIQHNSSEENARWHKTGKTKPIIENGVPLGWKKIMVLYKGSKKGCNLEKSKWVMHQYHLGAEEEEHDGEYVVSKISYQQQKQGDKPDGNTMIEEPDNLTIHTSPRTPKTITPSPPCQCKSLTDDDADENMLQDTEFSAEATQVLPPAAICVDNLEHAKCLAGESQAAENPEMNSLYNDLLCNEVIDSSALNKHTDFAHSKNEVTGNNEASCGIPELENLEFDTPPELADLQFGSQESFISWWERLG